MTDAVDVSAVCPFLGLPYDPQSHYSFPEGSHLCRAWKKAARIDLAHQASFCLGADYTACDRYKQRTQPVPTVRSATPLAPADAVAVPAGAPATMQDAHRRRFSRGLLVGAFVALLVLAAMGAVLGLGWRFPGTSTLPSSTPTVAVATLSGSQTALSVPQSSTPTMVPTLTPAPTSTGSLLTAAATTTSVPTLPPTPTPQPSPELTPIPTPTPISYTVQRGDTLQQIARRFGVSPESIVLLNGIHDPSAIEIGWVLLIPSE